MRRSLIVGVTAAVVLLGAPGHTKAAGVTRSAPFDFGIQCLTRDASAASTVGDGLPYGCDVVPDPVAMTGALATRQAGVTTGASIKQGGMTVGGAVGHATVGRMWSATGLNVNSGAGGKLTASAQASGTVCLTIAFGGGAFELAKSCGTNPSVSTTASPNQNYTIQVTLRDRTPDSVSAPSPCPPGMVVTCSAGAAVVSSDNQATVSSISYSIG